MKALKLLVLCVLTCCFAGCFEINEEIVLKDNGSGDFSLNMDMGKMLEMMQAFMPPDQMKEMEKVRDTTIQLKDLTDTLTTLSPDKKALLRDGSLKMQMNLAEKIFKVNMKYPFKNTSDLQKLYSSLGEAGSGMGDLMNIMNPGVPATGGSESEMKMISSYYDLAINKGSISRKLNMEKYAKLADDAKMQELKLMGEVGGGMPGMTSGDVKMNTVIKLASPAKTITGSKAELSTDKKTVIIKNSMMDIFSHPEVFEFSIQY